MAVIAVPSSTAVGSPVSGSNATISAWWVGRSVLCGNNDTSLAMSTPFDGTKPGIAPRNPFAPGTCATTRAGDEAAPELRSTMAGARAAMSASRSRRASTSARLRNSIPGS